MRSSAWPASQALGAHEMEQRAGVEVAAARAHQQAFGGREAHRCVHRAPVVHRADRRAVAQMADHGLEFVVGPPEEFGGFERGILMRGAVEAVATDLLLVEVGVGQAVDLRVDRHDLVKGGVEDGHVHGPREAALRFADAQQIDRVVQGRQRRRRFDRGDDLAVDDGLMAVGRAALDDAVADRGDLVDRAQHAGLPRRSAPPRSPRRAAP